ncbi:MAG: TetR family transcriptional regulator [Nevskiales bacterium]
MSAAQEKVLTIKDMPDGKQRLIRAAIKLSAQGTASLANLGIRELGREANLNPNTFYRHFSNMEELALAAGKELTVGIMNGMQKVRTASAKHADATEGSAEFFLQEVDANPDIFRMGLREIHGGTPEIRRILRGVLEDFAHLSVEQITAQNLVPGLKGEALFDASLNITYYMFYRALDYLDNPTDRGKIKADIIRFIRVQFVGMTVLDSQLPANKA